ncbi:hybrid non-ribosomal peptide synthetase/type I polyketide synthase [Paenibacillus larvae]|nr:hybrid non-ribosomal peptide synthetase/type I polyketide synthase [Paenibacillus larvae]AQR76918.1 hybrid non-ribosomal peptide synthetase/type I polyketide synthase [Paenibacillus larvae subsp. larvae]AVF22165.1 putative non-ribosomal peptide ligase/ polyketide synthase hybrid [Paenibacillus larvae subsp. larvae]ETK26993.1 putative non-ribosomal peptide ligase/ polyketide synthase hybrid [Paenibacillus larvae subsp. larvae DSM 25719]MCY7475516.1 hybrid non-ribosomal peptide synthetase/type
MRKINKSEVEDIISLTPVQEGMLFHYLQDPDSEDYHEQLCMNISGCIDLDMFQAAWNVVIRTNEMLRTIFRWEQVKQPVQIVLKEHGLHMRFVDIEQETPSQQASILAKEKRKDLQQKFNLQDVPFRISLFKQDVNTYTMLVSNHHILYDGWSNAIILKEFFTAYDHLSQQKEIMGKPKTKFKEFIKWLQSHDESKEKAFWQEYLKDIEESRPLSITRKNSLSERVIDYEKIGFSAETKRELESFAAEHELTLASIFFSAWGILLQRYKNSEDILFGTTVSGRPSSLRGCEDIVGLFINTIPLRVTYLDGISILEFLKRTNKDMQAREEYEHTSIVNIKEYGKFKHTSELFDTVMVIENYPLDQRLTSRYGQLNIDSYSSVEQTNYNLLISLEIHDDIRVDVSYNTGLYEQPFIAKMLKHFRNIVLGMVRYPENFLSDIEIISENEKSQILDEFNNTNSEYIRDKTVHEWFEEQVQKTPHHIAVVCGDEQITYRELNERANRLAHLLRNKGVEGDTIVGLMMERSIELVTAIIGILKAGGAYLPIDPSYPSNRISYMLQDSKAQVLIVDHKADKMDYGIDIVDIHQPDIEFLPSNNLPIEITDSHLVYVLYTSGSTGKPKGVLIEHRNLVNLLIWYINNHGIEEKTHIPFMTNYVFDPSAEQIFAPLIRGGTVYCIKQELLFNTEQFLNYLQQHELGLIDVTPVLLRELLYDKKNDIGLKRVIAGGERLDNQLKNQIIKNGFTLYNGYGPTETTVEVIFTKCELDRDVVLGKPIDNVNIYILHKHDELQPVGVVGELCIAGPAVGRGYLNKPELTKQRFVSDPFCPEQRMFRTGDLARWLPDGSIEYMGRQDDQVKINGVRIELQEIESSLLKHPQIKDAIVVLRENKQGEKYAAAYCVSEGIDLSHDEIKDFLRNILPDNMIPSCFVLMEKLPLLPSGKVDRAALPEPKGFVSNRAKLYIEPEKELEKAIAQIWKEALGIEQVGLHDNFFDIGGNSLKLIRVYGRLQALTSKEVTIADMFANPTVSTLSDFLSGKDQDKGENESLPAPESTPGMEIAVIGMAGRFPGAGSVDEFWSNLKNEVESIQLYSDHELRQLGINSEMLDNPAFVKTAGGILQDKDCFDASFFGYSSKEAELMDPQMRLLHECVWEALEHSGYNPESYPGKIGLYAGASDDFYWTSLISNNTTSSIDQYKAAILTRKDFLCTNISYKLNLRGPSYTVQTGCSTSLVAIVNAYQALQGGDCHMAVAGGVTIYPEPIAGYVFQDGMIFSPDGHCRAFDEKAQGTVPGEGVGVVVLKRLQAAIEDGDYIHAVIKGVATNNDGYRKVGFTAPSIEGQTEVIQAAHRMAEVEAESIAYVEAHGTATTLGDPVELEALRRAFHSEHTGFCAIGSVKTNIGHLDAAAGVAGFIKTVLALKHREIPASLHFHNPTPKFDFSNSPFYVNSSTSEWKHDKYPMRAGVSSFGIGGTNAHIVLEEAVHALSAGKNELCLIPLSARTEEALDLMSANLAEFVKENPAVSLSHVAYTLQTGRKAFRYRKTIVCSTHDEAASLLTSQGIPGTFTAKAKENPPVVFMFPGQGSQHVKMGFELYGHEPAFHEEMDRCFDILNELGAAAIKDILYPKLETEQAAEQIIQTEIAQPAIFIIEYALARLLMKRGISPSAMIGHSLGEYVAACISGVLSLEDALRLVTARGKWIQEMRTGSMLSVPLSKEEVEPLLNENISIAAVNAPAQCVISGDELLIDQLEKQLTDQGHTVKRLRTSHAFHSKLMDPVLERFKAEMQKIRLNPPQIPYISNVTGTWITAEEATDPNYWVKHLRETVYFDQGICELLDLQEAIFIETGPGRTLTSWVNRRKKGKAGQTAVSMSDNSQAAYLDRHHLLSALGKLWSLGINLNWNELYKDSEKMFRIPLPTYPFERKRYWPKDTPKAAKLENQMMERTSLEKKQEISDWFYMPSWERSATHHYNGDEKAVTCWLIFADGPGIGEYMAERLKKDHRHVITVDIGTGFRKISEQEYVMDPGIPANYQALFSELQASGRFPDRIIHLWSISSSSTSQLTVSQLQLAQDAGFYSCMYIAQSIGLLKVTKQIRMAVITSNMQDVTGEEALNPEQATVLGFVKICPLEYANISCQSIDITTNIETPDLIERILGDISAPQPDLMIAYRGSYRWTPLYKQVQLDNNGLSAERLKENGVYLITGGMGGIGFAMAQHLSKRIRANYVLLGRSPFPDRQSWSDYLTARDAHESTIKKIRGIQGMEENGSEVMIVSADLSCSEQMEEAIARIRARFGKINGVIHAAGIADYEGIIQNRTKEMSEKILAPKVKGTLILDSLLEDEELDFLVLFSSNGNMSYHYKFGQVSYNAANEFLDAYANYKRASSKAYTVSINWCDWKDVGMSVEAAEKWGERLKTDTQTLLKAAITISEGMDVINYVLSSLLSRVIVSPVDLQAEIAFEEASFLKMVKDQETYSLKEQGAETDRHMPAKTGEIQNTLISIWTDLLGDEEIGIHDNVFDLGANSLDMIQANSRLKAIMKQDIPIVTMYTYPTIHTLAEHLTRGEEAEQKPKEDKLNKQKSIMNKTLAKLKSHS